MLVTLLGIATLVRLEHPLNASAPMFVTLFGIIMLVMLAQFLNTRFDKTVLSVMVTDFKLLGIEY